MPRPPRLELAGVPLHIVQRGNNRGACFFGDLDRRLYLKCLGQAAAHRGCVVHAYVLMTNHVHLLLTPMRAGAASEALQDVGRRYVRIVNETRGRTGTLWEGRFKSSLIDSETYLLTCHRYIELNPVRAGLVQDPADHPWSSHRHYTRGEPDRLIAEHEVYTRLGGTPLERQQAFRSLFYEPLDEREIAALRISVNKGWGIGSDAFLDRIETAIGQPVRPPRRGRPPRKNASDPAAVESQPEMLF